VPSRRILAAFHVRRPHPPGRRRASPGDGQSGKRGRVTWCIASSWRAAKWRWARCKSCSGNDRSGFACSTGSWPTP